MSWKDTLLVLMCGWNNMWECIACSLYTITLAMMSSDSNCVSSNRICQNDSFTNVSKDDCVGRVLLLLLCKCSFSAHVMLGVTVLVLILLWCTHAQGQWTVSFINMFRHVIHKHFIFGLASLIALLPSKSLYNVQSILPHTGSKANLDIMRLDALNT